jgi:hypothetical protein
MYATIQRYAHVAGTPDDVALVGRQIASLLSAQPGFVSWVLVQEPDGVVATVGLFDDEPSAREISHLAARWLREHLDGVKINTEFSISGEV